MLSREDLEAFRARHIAIRERLIANVNVAQGAIDSASQLLKLWDENDAAVQKEIEKEMQDHAEEDALMNDPDADGDLGFKNESDADARSQYEKDIELSSLTAEEKAPASLPEF